MQRTKTKNALCLHVQKNIKVKQFYPTKEETDFQMMIMMICSSCDISVVLNDKIPAKNAMKTTGESSNLRKQSELEGRKNRIGQAFHLSPIIRLVPQLVSCVVEMFLI